MGVGLTIGAVAAISAWAMGLVAIRPAVERLNALGERLASAGGPPTAEQQAELGQLEAKLHRLGTIDVVLVAIAVVFMAISRYLVL